MDGYSHPIFVHLPLAVAMLLPLWMAASILAAKKGDKGEGFNRVWAMAAAPLLLAALFTILALVAGEAGKEAILEKLSGEGREALERHEELGELFAMLLYTAAGLSLFVFLYRGALRQKFLLGLLGLSAVLFFLGLGVGKSGGEVVYRHNAPAHLESGGEGAAD